MLSLSQQKLLTSLHHKKYRQKYRKFLVEGDKLAAELLAQSRIPVAGIFAVEEWAAAREALLAPYGGRLTLVTPAELKKVSTLATPNQVLAVAEMPENPTLNPTHGNSTSNPSRDNPTPNPSPEGEGGSPYRGQTPLPFRGGVGGGVIAGGISPSGAQTPLKSFKAFYLDGLQDPGNLGAILRVADWFGLTPVYCSPDCVDAYNPKVVQAGMGAVLRVPVIEITLDELLARMPGLPVLGAVLDGDDVFQTGLPPGGLLVVGNESRGISPAVAARLTQRLTIPRPAHASGAESLNAAAAAGILAAVWQNSPVVWAMEKT